MAEDVRTGEIPPPNGRRRQRPRLPVPFVTTDTATDLALAFALLPVWWALGIDQLVWLPLALFILVKRWAVEKRLRAERAVLILLGAFAASYLLSGLFGIDVPGEEKSGYGRTVYFLNVVVPYVSNAITYSAAAIFLILAADCARRERERLRILWGLAFMALGAVVAGALPYLGLPLRFEAPVRLLYPEGVAWRSPIFDRMVERSLSSDTCLFGYEVPRSRSIFFYSTLYAAALAMVVPVQAYLAWTNRGWLRTLWVSAAVLSLLGMLLTTSRTATAALVLAAGAIILPWALYVFVTRRDRRVPLLLAATVTLGVVLVAAAVVPPTVVAAIENLGSEGCRPNRGEVFRAANSLGQETGPQAGPRAEEGGLALLTARVGSLASRYNVYEASIKGWTKRPLFGWATQRYNAKLFLPVGSHSMYLGTLYQRGAVGLAVLLAMIGYAFFRLVRGFRRSDDARLRFFLGCAAVSLLAASLSGLLDIFDVDATVQVLYWTLIGLIVGATAPVLEAEE